MKKSMIMILWIFLVFPGISGADEEALSLLDKTSKAFSSIVKKVEPSVVFIKVEKEVEAGRQFQYQGNPFDFFGPDPLERFFKQPRQQPAPRRKVQGLGSGFIISADGYILTNHHVVGDADEITVTTIDGKKYKARRIGTDPKSDIAVIKVKGKKELPFLEFGDSSKLNVGEWVIAIGNPFGLTRTVSVGVVSAKGRSGMGITDYEDFIQTDAAINRGNSGGPLLNTRGKVIGMNTAIFSQTGGNMGIGFAIPANMVRKIMAQLIKNGKVVRGYLGIGIEEVTPENAEDLRLKVKEGVLVTQVQPGTAADKAGLRRYDVIMKFDGRTFDTLSSFRNYVSLQPPGAKKKLLVNRDGKQMNLEVVIGTHPDSVKTPITKRETIETELEFKVRDLTPKLARQFGYKEKNGVMITAVEPGSDAAAKGLRPGVLILEVNRKRVPNAEAFFEALEKNSKRDSVTLLLKFNDNTWIATVNIK